MDRYRMLPSYHYKNNEDGLLTESVGKPLRDYKIYGNLKCERLPDNYQRVEYIEATGKQYIDTNFTPTGRLTVRGKISLPQPTSEVAVMGADNYGWELGFSTTKNRMFSYLKSTSSIGIAPTISIYDIPIEFIAVNDLDNGYRSLCVNIEGSCAEGSNVDDSYKQNLLLFDYRKAYPFVGKCYRMTIYDNDNICRDFVPCYRKSDGEIGMYDLVNNVFYTNQGTEAFLRSDKEISNTAEITSVGENHEPSDDIGENLFPFTEGTWTDGGVTFTAADGVVTIEGATTSGADSDVVSAITFQRVTNYVDYATISAARSIILEPGIYSFKSAGTTSANHGVGLIVGDLGKSTKSSENPAMIIMNFATFVVEEPTYCMPIYAKYKNTTTYTITDIELKKVGVLPHPPKKYTNLVDVDYILEQNPNLIKRTTFQGRDCLNWRAGDTASNIFITPRNGFKENTAYTIRAEVASSQAYGTIIVSYTDGTSKLLKFQRFAPDFEANTFREIVYFTSESKTIRYLRAEYAAGEQTYIDINKFHIVEGIHHIPYIQEKATKYEIPLKLSSKNIANLEQVYRFTAEADALNDAVDPRTYIQTDKDGRQLLINYSATGYGKDGYTEARRIFQGIFKKNTQYTISFNCKATSASINIAGTYTDSRTLAAQTISNWADSTTVYSVKFTTAANKTLDSIRLNYSNGTSYIYLDTLQIEEGTSQTEYEPYNEQDIYLDEPLRKIDEYADHIDFKNQKVVRRIYHEKITDIVEKSGMAGDYSIFLSAISKRPYREGSKGFAVSDSFIKFTKVYGDLVWNGGYITSYITTAGGYRAAYTFNDATINTIELAQEKIGDGFDVYYILETPIEESIVLPKILTKKGTCVIDIDTQVPPSKTQYQYYKGGK